MRGRTAALYALTTIAAGAIATSLLPTQYHANDTSTTPASAAPQTPHRPMPSTPENIDTMLDEDHTRLYDTLIDNSSSIYNPAHPFYPFNTRLASDTLPTYTAPDNTFSLEGIDPNSTPIIPEPASMALMGLGSALILWRHKKK